MPNAEAVESGGAGNVGRKRAGGGGSGALYTSMAWRSATKRALCAPPLPATTPVFVEAAEEDEREGEREEDKEADDDDEAADAAAAATAADDEAAGGGGAEEPVGAESAVDGLR